jgi:hypothetical protein
MADNITAPGAGSVLATDDVGGVQYPRSKVVFGSDGVATDASADNPLPTLIDRTDNLLAMLSRVVKLLESNAVVDQQQRQRITLDAMAGGLTLATVTNVGTVGTVTTVAAQTTLAGMDREMHINTAKLTYAQSIRSRLEFI